MTFIIHFKDGHRETYSNRYDEDVEHERDAAWDDPMLHFLMQSTLNLSKSIIGG
jgi:hypothetical protein